MVTSGIRIGTPAITTRGLVESDMETVASLIDESLMNASQSGVLESVSKKVTEFMMERPLFAGNETFVHA
jgi:glycine hydroxymethyltransferase